jgi:hypothetical protein
MRREEREEEGGGGKRERELNSPGGKGIVIEQLNRHVMNTLGGPVEATGRLKYIDGCTDSLLVPPVKYGDGCLNALFFPPGTTQTMHFHPSVRVGMVLEGSGSLPLLPPPPSSSLPLLPPPPSSPLPLSSSPLLLSSPPLLSSSPPLLSSSPLLPAFLYLYSFPLPPFENSLLLHFPPSSLILPGTAVTPSSSHPLQQGNIFIMHEHALHKFNTGDDKMIVVAFHPDSDFGPKDEDHPMLNRTWGLQKNGL